MAAARRRRASGPVAEASARSTPGFMSGAEERPAGVHRAGERVGSQEVAVGLAGLPEQDEPGGLEDARGKSEWPCEPVLGVGPGRSGEPHRPAPRTGPKSRPPRAARAGAPTARSRRDAPAHGPSASTVAPTAPPPERPPRGAPWPRGAARDAETPPGRACSASAFLAWDEDRVGGCGGWCGWVSCGWGGRSWLSGGCRRGDGVGPVAGGGGAAAAVGVHLRDRRVVGEPVHGGVGDGGGGVGEAAVPGARGLVGGEGEAAGLAAMGEEREERRGLGLALPSARDVVEDDEAELVGPGEGALGGEVAPRCLGPSDEVGGAGVEHAVAGLDRGVARGAGKVISCRRRRSIFPITPQPVSGRRGAKRERLRPP